MCDALRAALGREPGRRRPNRGTRRPQQLLPLVAVATLAMGALGARPAQAHLIDEVAESVVIALSTRDRATFEAQFVLHTERLEAYFDQAEQLGMGVARSDAAFARRLAAGFAFTGCTLAPATAAVGRPVKGGVFRAFRLTVRCPKPVSALRLVRRDHDRARTRTTLYVTMRQGEAPARRLLLPPRLAALDIPLDGGRVDTQTPPRATSEPPAPTRVQATPGVAQGDQRRDTERLQHPTPGDPVSVRALPRPGPPTAPWRRALRPPPWSIVALWADAGARHLAGGLDHLLFLTALALAALRWRRLVLAAVCFSVGHLVTMALAIAFAWPSSPWVECAIGLSIAWAGVGARAPGLSRSALVGAAAFGLVHGAAFGSELRHLIGGSEGLVWPLLSFGVGLDVAQTVWVTVGFALWTPVRRRVATTRSAEGPAVAQPTTQDELSQSADAPTVGASDAPGWALRLQRGAAALLVAAGLLYGLRALL